nr:TIGR02594 family protein [Oceaniglobus trochenteri]
MNETGFGPLVEDGIKGPRTDAAITAFKRSIGFRARPYYGPLTHGALFDGAVDIRDATVGTDDDIPWMAEAARVKGLHEARDTARLRTWFDKAVSWIDPREIPWCGAFVATVMRRWQSGIDLVSNPLAARSWRRFGRPCDPQFGAVLVFWRGSRSGWQGHVGFYWGEDDEAFHVLGGNQSNAVTVARVSRSRLLEARWPLDAPMPGKRIRLSRDGQPLSANEA